MHVHHLYVNLGTNYGICSFSAGCWLCCLAASRSLSANSACGYNEHRCRQIGRSFGCRSNILASSPRVPHKSKPGEALVRPRDEVFVFGVQLEEYFSKNVLTLERSLANPVSFCIECTTAVIASEEVAERWRYMHDAIRLADPPQAGEAGAVDIAASEPALRESLRVFLEVHMLLRCREFLEKHHVGMDGTSSVPHVRALLGATGPLAGERAKKRSKVSTAPLT